MYASWVSFLMNRCCTSPHKDHHLAAFEMKYATAFSPMKLQSGARIIWVFSGGSRAP